VATNTPGEKGLSSSGVIEARKAQGAIMTLFSNLRAASKPKTRKTEEDQIRESRALVAEMNSLLEKKLG